MLFNFHDDINSNEQFQKAALEKKADIVKSFQKVCEENKEFKNAIEKTTNSLSATSLLKVCQ